MHRKLNELIITILVASLVAGTTGNVIAGISDCLPKACCCTKEIPPQMSRGDHVNMPVHCAPGNPAPCCQLDQDPQPTHLAISSMQDITPHRSLMVLATTGSPVTVNQTTLTIRRLLEDGRPKARTAPIYLQNQTILC